MAYGFSWLAWSPYVLSQGRVSFLPVSLAELALLPGAYLGPLLSGFLMTAATEGKPGVQRLLRRFVLWRVGWQWYLFTLVGVPLLTFLGYLVVPGGVAVLHNPFPQLLLLYPLFLVVEILTSALAEEPGWRGFALPRLQTRYGALLGTLILGTLWGCWHLPLFLAAWGHGASWLDIVVFILTTIGNAILITWAFNHTRGSLLLAILFHASLDATGSSLGTLFDVRWLFQTQWLVQNSSLAQLFSFVVVPLLLILVTRGRLGYKRTTSSSDEVM
jgi:membrane protease YdiL (CAAX protease family)